MIFTSQSASKNHFVSSSVHISHFRDDFLTDSSNLILANWSHDCWIWFGFAKNEKIWLKTRVKNVDVCGTFDDSLSFLNDGIPLTTFGLASNDLGLTILLLFLLDLLFKSSSWSSWVVVSGIGFAMTSPFVPVTAVFPIIRSPSS